MQNPKDKKIISRYFSIIIFMAVVGIAILAKATFIVVFERSYWEQVRNRSIVDSVSIQARRGNIFADDGQLLASSMPQYTLFMDFYVSDTDEKRRTDAQYRRDTLIKNNLDVICEGLHSVLPEKSVEEFKRTFREGMAAKNARIATGPSMATAASRMPNTRRLPSCP